MTRLLHPLDRIRLKGGNQAQLQVRQTDEVWTDLMVPQITTTSGFNVMDYGAVGNGVTDDTVAIMAAVLAASDIGGGDVVFPAGTFVLSSTLAATDHVRLVGQGIGNIASGTITPVTTILWAGGAAKMFTSDAKTNSWSFDGIHLDGNGVATHGVHVMEMHDQHWGPTSIIGCVTRALLLEGRSTGNTAFNVFEKLILHNMTPGGTALELKGDVIGNVCHNVFLHLYAGFSGNDPGIVWGDSDNNNVIFLAVARASGTGYGLEFTTNSRANYFRHVELPGGGDAYPMVARTGTRNSIDWYDRENGQLAPVIEGTAVLNYNSDIYGYNIPGLAINNGDDTVTQFNVAGVFNNNIRGLSTNFWHTICAKGQSILTSGAGGEFFWQAGVGAKLTSYDHDGTVYLPLYLDGLPLYINKTSGLAVDISGPVTMNAAGEASWDLTVGGDTDANLLAVDASADKVGIGVAAPSFKLDVNGDARVASGSSLRVGGQTESGVDGARLSYTAGNAYLDHKGAGQLHIRTNNTDGTGGGLDIGAFAVVSTPPLFAPIMALTDGVAAPSTSAGNAQIYVDVADGDLKVKFGDGTVKTIVVDT